MMSHRLDISDSRLDDAVGELRVQCNELCESKNPHPELGSIDLALVDSLATQYPDRDRGALERARQAELLALELYRREYGTVVDLNAEYLHHPTGSVRYKRADLATPHFWVDVKNVRDVKEGGAGVHHWTTGAFCLDDGGQDVRLSAFLSHESSRQFQWVGEVTRGQLCKTVARYPRLDLQLKIEGEFRLPEWCFSLPIVASSSYRRALGDVERYLNCNEPIDSLLPYYVRFRLPFPIGGNEVMAPEFNRLRGVLDSGETLASLYLYILNRFVEPGDFPSEELKCLLYPKHSRFHDEVRERMPLAIPDPFSIIWRTIELLSRVRAVWSPVSCYSSYRVKSSCILSGVRGNGEEDTILAYCGGCGSSPIYLGRSCNYGEDRACPSCRRIKCADCGYCSPICAQRVRRSR